MNKNRIAKVISWRIASIMITMILMVAMVGDVKEASKITVVLHGLLTLAHYTFEGLWERYREDR